MKILITGDFHGRLAAYDWLQSEESRFDAILLTGDLLDPFGQDLSIQMQFWKLLDQKIRQRGGLLATCQGEHDAWFPDWEWMKRKIGTVHYKSLCVTSTSWRVEDRGPIQKPTTTTASTWIVLNHEPPPGLKVSVSTTSDLIRPVQFTEHQPDYLICGHLHDAPFLPGGSWWDHFGHTIVFNPGQNSLHPPPTHIILDLDAHSATWMPSHSIPPVVISLPESSAPQKG